MQRFLSRAATRFPLLLALALFSAFGLVYACLVSSPTAEWLPSLWGSLLLGAAVTADQIVTRRDPDRGAGPVAASTLIYQGTLCFIDANGYVNDDTASGANKFAGVAVLRYDNSSGAAAAINAEYWKTGTFLLEGSGFAQTSVGKPVFATNNYTVTTTPTDGAVYIGRCATYVSSTKIYVEIDTNDQRLAVISEVVTRASMTDGGGTSGTKDLTATLPAGAVVLAWKAVVATGFTGDTSATMIVGVSGDTDRFSDVNTPSVFAAGTVGARPQDEALNGIDAAVTVRVTITSAADFTNVAAGSLTLTIYYLAT